MQRSHSRLVTVTSNQDIQTSERLLIAAEKLFSEQGFSAVSLRKIMTKANANVASIHYYFGSEEKVLEAIFKKHGAELNSERHRLLDAYERKPGRGFSRLLKYSNGHGESEKSTSWKRLQAIFPRWLRGRAPFLGQYLVPSTSISAALLVHFSI